MFVFILLFSISLLLILGLITYQILRMRNGLVVESKQSIPWPDELLPTEYDFVAILKILAWYGKRYGHLFVLVLLKGWIKVTYYIRRKKEIYLPRIKVFLFRNKPNSGKPGPVSAFLKNLGDYKNRLKDISEKIIEEEEQIQEERESENK